jgi:DNA-binding transcriptional LysR family regulator
MVAEMERSIDLNALRTFVTAIELGGLSKAARYLGMPKSTVSRHVTKLEYQIGATLVTRDQTGIELTSVGRNLFETAHAGIDSFQRIGIHFSKKDKVTRGAVRIKAPRTFGRGFLSQILSEFCSQYPLVSTQITLSDRIFDPEDDRIDIAFCVGISVPSSLDAWELGTLDAKLYAAPSYLKQAVIEAPSDLCDYAILSSLCGTNLKDRWLMRTTAGKEFRLDFVPKLETNETDFLLAAALDGMGVARLPTFVAEPHRASGKLISVLPEWSIDRHRVSLAAKNGIRTQAIEQFIEFCAPKIRTQIEVN